MKRKSGSPQDISRFAQYRKKIKARKEIERRNTQNTKIRLHRSKVNKSKNDITGERTSVCQFCTSVQN